jgi:hypothetical protein
MMHYLKQNPAPEQARVSSPPDWCALDKANKKILFINRQIDNLYPQ